MKLLGVVACHSLCLTLLPFSTFAQTAAVTTPSRQTHQETSDVVRINTELVQTGVMVFDRQGRFVDGLDRGEFEVRIDGKLVPVSFFERVGVAGPGVRAESANASTPGKPGAVPIHGRNIIFFLDDLHLGSESIDPVRKGLLNFIDNQMRPDDQVAIVSASGQIGFLQQFSDHPSVLRAAIARVNQKPYSVLDSENVAMSEYVAYRIAQGDRDTINYYVNELLRSLQFTYALPKYGGKGAGYQGGSESDQAERMVIQRAQALISESLPKSLVALSSLEGFLRTSSRLPGRKTVLFISDGFLMHDRNSQLSNKLQRVTDAAARAGGVIYSIDAGAFTGKHQASRMKLDSLGRSDKFNSGETAAFQGALELLANNTGGRALLESQALAPAIDEALKESVNYYLVAWSPENEEQKVERFKNISISVAGRPELTVRLVRGYLVANAKVPVSQKEHLAPLGGVLKTAGAEVGVDSGGLAANRALPTRLSLSFVNTPGNGMVLTASTQLVTDAQLFGENTRQAAVDLGGLILNDQGKLASSFQTRLTVDQLSRTAAEADAASVIYNYRAPVTPGLYQVRVAARHPQSGRVGRATQWIEIPNLASRSLLLSSLLLDGRVIEDKGQGGSLQMQHSVARRFARASRLSFLLFIYNASRSGDTGAIPNLTADIQVIQDGRAMLNISQLKVPIEPTADLERIPYGGSFPLSKLSIGRYLLRVTITDQVKQTRASQHIDFEIE